MTVSKRSRRGEQAPEDFTLVSVSKRPAKVPLEEFERVVRHNEDLRRDVAIMGEQRAKAETAQEQVEQELEDAETKLAGRVPWPVFAYCTAGICLFAFFVGAIRVHDAKQETRDDVVAEMQHEAAQYALPGRFDEQSGAFEWGVGHAQVCFFTTPHWSHCEYVRDENQDLREKDGIWQLVPSEPPTTFSFSSFSCPNGATCAIDEYGGIVTYSPQP